MVSNLYLNVDAKTATLRVTVGGVLLTEVLSAEWSFAFNRPPTALVRVPNPPSAAAAFGATVTIDAGWNGLTQRCFTGTVLNVNPDELGCVIECQGKSAVLENAFHEIVVSVDGTKTATQLVVELLVAAGLTDYSVNLPAWTPGTVCPQDLTFQTYGEGVTKIAEVDGGQWYETPTGTVRVNVIDPVPSTTAWRTYFSGVLAGLTEGYPAGVVSGRPRLRHISQAQHTRDVKNEAVVRGCTYTQTNPDGTEVSIDVEGRAMAGSPWVKNPDGSQAYNDILFSNELIDTPVKAGSVAARLVTLLNRRLTEIAAQVDGDVEVVLGATIGLIDPSYSRTGGNWFVGGYRTRIDSSQFVTELTTLYGGAESGYTVNVCPFALFTYFTDLQVMGDRVWAMVTFDACTSVDPDGHIVLYSWTDNQTPHKVSGSGTDCIFTQRVDPTGITGTWQVTLTVIDNGTPPCSDDITLPVAVDEGTGIVQVPALFVAFDAWFSASPDGGVTWNDQAAPAGWGVVAVGCKPPDGEHYGYGVYGLSGTTAAAGRLYRTTDYCATAPACVLSGVDSPFEHVWWDLNHPTDCWALTWDGELWRSQDDGDAGSWLVYKDLNTLPWLVSASGEHVHGSRIATPAPNGVWVFGGQYPAWGGGGALVGWPLICWDANLDGNWAQAQIGGELLSDLGAGGPTDLYIKEAASREADELAILFNSATWLTGVYYTPDILGDGSEWLRATGAPAKGRGRWIAPDFAVGKFALAYNDAVIYRGDVDPVTNRMAVTVAPAHLDTGPSGTDEPNHGLWIGAFNWWMPGVYLVAAQGPNYPGLVYKSWDRFDTIGKLRPATGFEAAHAASKGKMIALGPSSEIVGTVSHPYMIISDGAADRRLVRLVNSVWETVNAAMPANAWDLRYWGGAHMTHCVQSALPRYSDDYGVTWNVSTVPVGVLYGPYIVCTQIDSTPGSTRLWSIWRDNTSCTPSGSRHYCIAYSDDWGATWTLSLEETQRSSILNYFHTFYTIACHPVDPNKIFAAGLCLLRVAGRVTVDGGATWTKWPAVDQSGPTSWPSSCPPTVSASQMTSIWSVGGRMLMANQNTGEEQVSWSNDFGDTWTSVVMDDVGDVLNPIEFCRAGPTGPIFFCYNSATAVPILSPIFRSFNEGTTWERVGVPATWLLLGAAQRAIAYDLYYNWLWFPMMPGVATQRATCYSFEDPAAGDEDDWVDREYNLDSIGAGMDTPAICAITIVWD